MNLPAASRIKCSESVQGLSRSCVCIHRLLFGTCGMIRMHFTRPWTCTCVVTVKEATLCGHPSSSRVNPFTRLPFTLGVVGRKPHETLKALICSRELRRGIGSHQVISKPSYRILLVLPRVCRCRASLHLSGAGSPGTFRTTSTTVLKSNKKKSCNGCAKRSSRALRTTGVSKPLLSKTDTGCASPVVHLRIADGRLRTRWTLMKTIPTLVLIPTLRVVVSMPHQRSMRRWPA